MTPETVAPSSLFAEPPPVNPAVVAAADAATAAVSPAGPAGSAAGPQTGATDAPTGYRLTTFFGEAAETDAGGTPFDAQRHLRSKHPRTGRWMPRRPARNGATTAAPAATGSFVAPDRPPGTGTHNGAEAAEATGPDAVTVAAETGIGLIQTALVLLGEEEGVLSGPEKLLLQRPLERVLRKYQVGEMPVELDLAVALSAVVIARLKRPKTMARWERLKLWWKMKGADRRGHAQANAVARHAHVPDAATIAEAIDRR